MHNTIRIILLMLFLPIMASAQFYTITKGKDIIPIPDGKPVLYADNKVKAEIDSTKTAVTDTIEAKSKKQRYNSPSALKCDVSTSAKSTLKKSSSDNLPELTIPNLYEEIRRNGILYPKVVLAQAILETGWFRSSLCRERHNLFGLTNPHTGKYYEFDHWTESVRAYFTKVQYKYKGGNYLLWLRDIGYAEDPEYVRAVIGVLRML
ncbi:glucosaminidase domain-containing protein [Bacteroides faecis]|uniref:Glucosaminidase domain-containing protein n=1 Tax=Bacteroides faecis TaxID=674529 RepID=A0AAW5NZ48_9BACE|nr:glucosaminidase domain-containing protein [Bacteroides faecis]MCS2793828.1 glucosaminidase domain-containing protein [Bacteroides faecis]